VACGLGYHPIDSSSTLSIGLSDPLLSPPQNLPTKWKQGPKIQCTLYHTVFVKAPGHV
jgi:hypothetical protein